MTTEHGHDHAHPHTHDHDHAHDHSHGHEHGHAVPDATTTAALAPVADGELSPAELTRRRLLQ
ncbi:histidinol-phosphatase, partial [Nocardioides sp. CFH 31398]|nr:histidinol-phosphatase [Nocardioides sp. CFH 31398]